MIRISQVNKSTALFIRASLKLLAILATKKKKLAEQYPKESKEVRCNRTPYIDYPLIESFRCVYR